jgi:LacI family transcriptional regulator
MKKAPEKTRIKDIALLSGLSEGTVDRVLHNRGNVSASSQKKVEDALAQMDYKPNVYASALAQKKKIHLICIIPKYNSGDYWESVASGINKAHEEMSMLNVYINTIYFDQYDLFSCRKAFETTLSLSPDGVLFPPFFKEESIALTTKLNDSGIPFVFLDSYIADTNVLAYYGQDSFRSGAIAAKLLMSIVDNNAKIALFQTYRNGNLGSNQTKERKNGFLDYLSAHHPTCKTFTIGLNATEHNKNLEILKQHLSDNPETKGVVIFNSLSYIVTKYLKEIGRQDIKVIGYDILQRNKECLLRDEIHYLIAQRPDEQGYLGVKALCENLLFNRETTKINYMPIDIIVKENIEYA